VVYSTKISSPFFVGYFNSILAIQAVGFTMMAGAISVVVFKPYKKQSSQYTGFCRVELSYTSHW